MADRDEALQQLGAEDDEERDGDRRGEGDDDAEHDGAHRDTARSVTVVRTLPT